MRVIFLDIDGVLNGAADNFIGVSQTEMLNRIVEATGAVVVIASAWRKCHSRTEMCDLLVDAGFRGRVVGMTPDFFAEREERRYQPYCRGHEIQAWIDRRKAAGRGDVEAFVILEDAEEMGDLEARTVRTDAVTGLVPDDIDRAVKLLVAP